MARRTAPVSLTDADLQAAWLQRRRGNWPPSFAEVMDHPMLRRLVRAEAIGRALALRRHQARHGPMPAAPAAPAAEPPRRPLDRKRLAAGEREDD